MAASHPTQSRPVEQGVPPQTLLQDEQPVQVQLELVLQVMTHVAMCCKCGVVRLAADRLAALKPGTGRS